jgi:ribosome-associated protein
MLFIILFLLIYHQESMGNTEVVHAFTASSTTTSVVVSTHPRIGKPSKQRQVKILKQPISNPKLTLSLASFDNMNNFSDSTKNDSRTPQSQRQETPRVLSNQQGKREMLDSIMAQPPIYTEGDTTMDINNNILPIIDDSTQALIDCIVIAADGRKADNIAAWYVAHMTTMTSVLIVVSGNSRPQNQAICAAIRTAVSQLNTHPSNHDDNNNNNNNNNTIQSYQYPQPSIEGTAESGWMILDYGSVMVHVMTPKSRLFYNVEGKWKQPQPMITSGTTTVMTTAIPLDLSNLLVPNTAATTTVTSNDLQSQPPRRMLQYDGNDVRREQENMIPNTSIVSDFETDQDVVAKKQDEDELDPFWS